MNQRGFTLIELLVITGVILVLAAVLSPVLTKAGPASVEEQDLVNMTNISQTLHLYYNDFDQARPPRSISTSTVCLSWKQMLDPYVSRTGDFVNPGNPAAHYVDAYSDAAARHALCFGSAASLVGHRQYKRGYYWNNLFGPRGGMNPTYWSDGGLSLSHIVNPATTGDVTEGKSFWADQGPFTWWFKDVDSDTLWMGTLAPNTNLKWNNSASHYKDTGMNVAMVDGHAKAVRFQQFCDPWISVNPATGAATVVNSKYVTFWNFSIDGIKALGSAGSYMLPDAENYCITRVKVSSKPTK